MDVTEHIITAKNLHYTRAGKVILDGVDLYIPRYKVTAIMGPSGTGKTTLLNLMSRQLFPDEGSICFDGVDLTSLNRKQLYQMRRRMGVLFQQGGLFTDLNVFENVAFALREHTDLSNGMIHDLVLMMLHAVGLRGAAQLRIDQLSGGMARRVALARAVIMGPELMLYDEPFSGQDPISRGVLLQLIRQLNDALGMTSVLVSHDVAETAKIADSIYIITGGKVIGEGDAKWLLQDTSPQVRQFVNGLPDGVVSFHYPALAYQEDLYL